MTIEKCFEMTLNFREKHLVISDCPSFGYGVGERVAKFTPSTMPLLPKIGKYKLGDVYLGTFSNMKQYEAFVSQLQSVQGHKKSYIGGHYGENIPGNESVYHCFSQNSLIDAIKYFEGSPLSERLQALEE